MYPVAVILNRGRVDQLPEANWYHNDIRVATAGSRSPQIESLVTGRDTLPQLNLTN